MSEDIGGYYDRKRRAALEATRMLNQHIALCPDCQWDEISGSRPSCKKRRQLQEARLDAGNTGD